MQLAYFHHQSNPNQNGDRKKSIFYDIADFWICNGNHSQGLVSLRYRYISLSVEYAFGLHGSLFVLSLHQSEQETNKSNKIISIVSERVTLSHPLTKVETKAKKKMWVKSDNPKRSVNEEPLSLGETGVRSRRR